MAHDWKKVLELLQVMQMSSGYPNQSHIFQAAQKDLEEAMPKSDKERSGQFAPNESQKPVKIQELTPQPETQPGPPPSTPARSTIPPIPPDDRDMKRRL